MFQAKAVRGSGLGTGYSNDETWTTTGGETVPYYMSMRFLLDFRKGYKEEVNGEMVKVANIITISNVKNKLSEPYKKADLMIRYGYGTDDSIPIFMALQDFGYITKKPNTSQYSYENEETKISFVEKSQEAFLEKLVNTPKYWADALKLYKELMESGSSATTSISNEDEDDEDEEDLDEDDED